jgi:hypothetical protein
VFHGEPLSVQGKIILIFKLPIKLICLKKYITNQVLHDCCSNDSDRYGEHFLFDQAHAYQRAICAEYLQSILLTMWNFRMHAIHSQQDIRSEEFHRDLRIHAGLIGKLLFFSFWYGKS